MPGSGKTTVGKLLGERMSLEFIDLDEYIETKANKSIEEIFIEGEAAFRKLETQAIQELINKSQLVLSTGGGVVKNFENMDLLRSNGVIVFINRRIEEIVRDIDFNKRPLLKNNNPQKIYDLYQERNCLYKKYCDIEIVNAGEISTCVSNIILKLKDYVEKIQKG